eukprot:6177097-Pleurochrysis_carterae.AAC.1
MERGCCVGAAACPREGVGHNRYGRGTRFRMPRALAPVQLRAWSPAATSSRAHYAHLQAHSGPREGSRSLVRCRLHTRQP